MRWNDISEGDEAPSRVVGPVTRTDLVRYQGASGDFNPIHHDETYARAAGFDAPLGIGMLPAGIMAACAAEWLGPENVRRVKFRWKAPVWPGDVLTFTCRVVAKESENGERKVALDLLCTNQDGKVAVEGWADFALS